MLQLASSRVRLIGLRTIRISPGQGKTGKVQVQKANDQLNARSVITYIRRLPGACALAFCVGLALPAWSHDFWLQPARFTIPVGAVVPMTIQVGHGKDRTRWSGDLERVRVFVDVGSRGRTDQKAALKQGVEHDGLLSFPAAGVQVLAFESTHASSILPAIRFNTYLQAEGLTPALALRARQGQGGAPGREVYSRCAKAIIQVGAKAAGSENYLTTPVGLTLEIVPERNPYRLHPGEDFPVRVFYQGRPLAGATVMLTSLEFDSRAVATHLTDQNGRTAFDLPRVGTWLVNVLWTRPIQGNPGADFDTTFSSLTFGFTGSGLQEPSRR